MGPLAEEALSLGVVSALLTLLVARHARGLGERLQLMDLPDMKGGRKRHRVPTPTVGGIALMLGVAPALVLPVVFAPAGAARMPLWFLIAVGGIFLLGTLDDRLSLSATARLLATSALLLLAMDKVPDFALHALIFSGQQQALALPGAIGLVFTLLCLVGLLNAVNMTDGKNGMAIGQAILWTLILLARAPAANVPLLVAILASLAVLLYFNMKGSLFLGDGGSYGLAAMLGLLAIHVWNGSNGAMRSDDIALIFAVPVFDTIRLIVHRVARGKSPFTPGRDHLHHYLESRWGWPQPLPLVLLLVALPNLGAILWPGTATLWLLGTGLGYVALLWLTRAHVRFEID